MVEHGASQISERKALSQQMAGRKNREQKVDKDAMKQEHDEYGVVLYNAIQYLTRVQEKADVEEMQARQMRRSNAPVALHLLVHPKKAQDGSASQGPPKSFKTEVSASISLSDLKNVVKARCRLKSKWFQLLWREPGGSTIELNSSQEYSLFTSTMWCQQPWCLHVRDEDSPMDKAQLCPLMLYQQSKIIFDAYDVGNDGHIGKAELRRMLIGLRLERYVDVSELLIDRFLDGEYERLNTDGSESLSLAEFTVYMTSMPKWQRTELLAEVI